jgi:hypothetical protein
MLKDQPQTVVTVIGSALVALSDGAPALTIYTQERGSIGFRLSPRAIAVLRQSLDEAEAAIGKAGDTASDTGGGGGADPGDCARDDPGTRRARSG